MFVDTSDMWLAPKWPRIAVSLAGIYVHFILAGLSSFLAFYSTNSTLSLWAWLFALASYLLALINLNPVLELDGYYALCDLLNRPNLKADGLRWVKRKVA